MTEITSKKRLRKMLRRRMKMERLAHLCERGQATLADVEGLLRAVKNPTAWGLSAEGNSALEAYAESLRKQYEGVPQKTRPKVKLPPTLQTAVRGAILQAKKRAVAGTHVEG